MFSQYVNFLYTLSPHHRVLDQGHERGVLVQGHMYLFSELEPDVTGLAVNGYMKHSARHHVIVITPEERADKKAAKKQRQKDNKSRLHGEIRDGARPNSNPKVSPAGASHWAGPQFGPVVVSKKTKKGDTAEK